MVTTNGFRRLPGDTDRSRKFIAILTRMTQFLTPYTILAFA